jgi:hypothetical protein
LNVLLMAPPFAASDDADRVVARWIVPSCSTIFLNRAPALAGTTIWKIVLRLDMCNILLDEALGPFAAYSNTSRYAKLGDFLNID